MGGWVEVLDERPKHQRRQQRLHAKPGLKVVVHASCESASVKVNQDGEI